MAKLASDYTNPLIRSVIMAEWTMLAVTIVLETIYLSVQFDAAAIQRSSIVISCLSILALLSLYYPLQRPSSFRFLLMFGEIFVVLLSTIWGNYRWIWPLYLVLIARASLIVGRKQLYLLAAIACLCQIGWYFARSIAIAAPHDLVDVLAIGGTAALMMTLNTCVLAVVVAGLMLSLINEQKLRGEAERLARENEILAAELERTRIAREIHDTVGHSLTSLKIQLELAARLLERGDDKAIIAVAQAENLAARSLTDTRVALQSIRNANFDFHKAVEELASDVVRSGSVKVHIDLQDPGTISNAVSYQLYRVIQECLTNTLKHAQASDVYVELRTANGAINLSVRDNGKGLSDKATDGFGLKGIKERITSVGGDVSICSERDQGTAIKVMVPREP